MSGRFTVRQAAGDGYVFQFEDDNLRVMFTSVRFGSRGGAAAAIDSLRSYAIADDRYERLITPSGHTYFNLKTADNEMLGTSAMFTSPQARLDAIEYMKRAAPRAPAVEMS